MKQIIVRNQHYGWDLLLILALVAGVLAVVAHCEEPLPNAPEPQQTHRLITREYTAAFAANVGLRIYDVVSTCATTDKPNFREHTTPSQTCGGIAAWNLSMVPAQVAVVAALEHYHHHKLARVAAWAFPVADIPAIIYTATHQNQVGPVHTVIGGSH